MTTKLRYHAAVSDDGVINGFYTSDIWPKPPEGAVEITQEQWRQFLDGQAGNPSITHRFINGEMVPFKPEPPPMTVPMSYAAAITIGIAVTSASGIIPPTMVSLAMQQLANLANVTMYIYVNGKFPGGQDSLPLVTTDGGHIDIPTTDAWQEIATAAADYVAKCDVAMRAGMKHGTWAAPNNAVTIA